MDKKTKIFLTVGAAAGIIALIALTFTPTSPIYYQTIAQRLVLH